MLGFLKKFLFLVFFFIFFTFSNSQNILLNNNPHITQSENNQYFNSIHLNDDNMNTLYSTGMIFQNSSVNITYTLDSTYCIDDFKIFWMSFPIYFKVFIGETIDNMIEVYNYYNTDESEEYYTVYVEPTTELDFCDQELYSKYIRVSLINNDTTMTHSMIREIQGFGLDVHKQLENIEPQDIPLNSIPEFMVDVEGGVEIRISEDGCVNTFHLDNYYFNKQQDYDLCYKHFPQNFKIRTYNVLDIFPKTIHVSSFTKLNINSTNFDIPTYIGLSYNCNSNNIHSISNIIGNSVNLYEEGDETGLYYVCYKLNNIWGNTNLQLNLVKPIINNLFGCVDENHYTKDCPTIGGKNMTIIGENFFNYYNYPSIRFGDNIVHNNIHINNTHIQSILPQGSGKNINVSVLFETESDSKTLLSYMKPNIEYISGCNSEFPKIQNCPNNYSFPINIIGSNFGIESSTILIGSSMCNNIQHISHNNISCILQGSRGLNNVVYVIQKGGDISEGRKLISYKECDRGYELVNEVCVMCKRGYYKDFVGDGQCNLCVDGTYNEGVGSVKCDKCMDNSLSSENRYDCYCKEGYYMNGDECIECDNMDFFGNIIYYCKESGLTIQTLQNEDGYWRGSDNSINFYKCRVKDYCPMNCIINSSVICKEFHTGLLCNFCVDGYAKDNNGNCNFCERKNKGLVSGMFILIFSVYSIIIACCLLIGNKYLTKGVNVTINNEEEDNCEDESEDESEDAEVLLDAKSYSNDVMSQLLQKLKIMITYLQINTILSINLNLKWPQFMTEVMNAFKKINLEMFDIIGLSYRCSVKFDFYHIFVFKMFMIPIVFFLTSVTYLSIKYWGKFEDKCPKFLKVLENRYIYILVLMVFILYPSVCNTILQLYKCEEIEGTYYLTEDLSLECYDDMWNKYAIGGVFMMCVYILGIPLFFYRKLKSLHKQELLGKKEYVYKYGFMYLGYKDNMWWFEILELMRKTVLSASIIYLQESATRIIVAMFVCGMYLLYITYNQPQLKNNDAFLSILSATEIFLLLFCGLILEVKIDIQDNYNIYAFDGVMFVMFITLLFIGNYQIIKSLKENNIFTLIYKFLRKYILKAKGIIDDFCTKTQEIVEEIQDGSNIVRIIRETSL